MICDCSAYQHNLTCSIQRQKRKRTYCDHSSSVADYKHKWRYIWVSSKKGIAKKIYSNNYLTETNIGHLKLVLVNWSSQATVKEFNTSTQSTLLTKNVIKHNTLKVKYSNILDSLYYIEHKDWNLGIFSVYIIVSGNLEIQRSFRNICWLYPPNNAHTCVKQIDSMLMAWSFFIHTLQ